VHATFFFVFITFPASSWRLPSSLASGSGHAFSCFGLGIFAELAS
jgi:hypothetical protein